MNKKYIHTYFHCTPFVNIVLEYIVCPTRSIIILRGKIRARRVKSACEKIDCRSDERRAFKCRRQVWCRRIVGESRGKKGDERTLDGERKGSPYTLERNCILRFSTLGVGIAKNSLAIKKRREREREEKRRRGRVKPTGGRD